MSYKKSTPLSKIVPLGLFIAIFHMIISAVIVGVICAAAISDAYPNLLSDIRVMPFEIVLFPWWLGVILGWYPVDSRAFLGVFLNSLLWGFAIAALIVWWQERKSHRAPKRRDS
jgi:hypothetical protein